MLAPERALALLDDVGSHIPGTRFRWALVLEPLDRCATRIQVRIPGSYAPGLAMSPLGRLVFGPAAFPVVSGQMLRGIRRRVDRAARLQ